MLLSLPLATLFSYNPAQFTLYITNVEPSACPYNAIHNLIQNNYIITIPQLNLCHAEMSLCHKSLPDGL